MEENQNLVDLYNALHSKGVTSAANVGEFKTLLDDENNRKELWQALNSKGVFGGNYDEFNTTIGYAAPAPHVDVSDVEDQQPTQVSGKPSYEEWSKTVPADRNDMESYNLKRAYELAPMEELEAWRTSSAEDLQAGKNHLHSAYENPETGEYEFVKRKDHPTIQMELDWYNSDDPEAVEFRKKYALDKSGDYYKYVPRGEEPKPAWMPNRMGGIGGDQNYFPNQTSVNLQQSIAKRKEWEAYSQTAEAKALREEQKNIRQQAIDEIDEKSERGFMGFLGRLGAGMVNDPYGMYTKENGAIVSELTEKSVEDAKYQDARRKLKKSLKEIKGEDWRADGTMRGLALARGIALADYESMAPLASASDAFSELDLALKIRDGKELTDADKTLLQALTLDAETSSLYGDNAGVLERVGKSLPEQVLFTLKFLVGGELTGATKMAGEVAKKAAERQAERWGQREVGKFTRMMLGRVVPELEGITVGAGMQTFLNPQSWLDIATDVEKRMAGNVYFDDKGDLHVFDDNKGFGQAFYQAAASAFVENFTEFMGEDIEKAAKLWKTHPKMMQVAQNWDDIMKQTGLKKVQDLFEIPAEWSRKTGISGSFGEFGEEVFGNIFNALLGTERSADESYGDSVKRTLSQSFSGEQMLETFLSCAFMSVGMGSMASAANGVHSSDYKRSVAENTERAKAMLKGVKGLDTSALDAAIDNGSIKDIAQWAKAESDRNGWTEDEQAAVVNYMLRRVEQAGIEHDESLQIQQAEEQVREQAQGMVNRWDGNNIYNATYQNQDGSQETVQIVNGRVWAKENADGGYDFNPNLSSGMLAVRFADGSVRQVSSRSIKGVQSVQSVGDYMQQQGFLVREQLRNRFEQEKMLPTMESVFGASELPTNTPIGGYFYKGKDANGNHLISTTEDEKGEPIIISESQLLQLGIESNISALQMVRTAEAEEQIRKMKEERDFLQTLDETREAAERDKTEESWTALENLLSERVKFDEQGGIIPSQSDPQFAAAYMYAKARGDMNAAINNTMQALQNKQGQLAEMSNVETESAELGGIVMEGQANMQARTNITEQIAFLEKTLAELQRMGEEERIDKQQAIENTPVSQMEVGQEFPVMYDGQQAVAAVVGKDADGRNVLTIRDQEGNDLESGIDDWTDEQWERFRVRPEEATAEPQQEGTEPEAEGIEQQPTETKQDVPENEQQEKVPVSPAQQTFDGLVQKYGDKAGHKIDVTAEDKSKTLDKAKKALEKAQTDYDDAPIGKEEKAEAALQKAQEEYNTALAEKQEWDEVKSVKDRFVAEQIAAKQAAEEERHAQAVAEEEARRAEEERKAREREATGANNVAPNIREKWEGAPRVEGNADEITLANGERIAGHYVLVESGAASASHDALNGFAKTEGFPLDENEQSVNDRDYERDKNAQQITRQIANEYDSRALQDPVVVSQDGVVLSGNGRTMAGEIAAAQDTDGAYIDYLKKYAPKYGFAPEQVEGMAHPRVVFVPDASMPYTAETFAKFNQQEMKGQSKTEQAVKLGKLVDDATFGRIIRSINRFDTLGDFYADTNATADAIGELLKAGAINQMQHTEMFDGDAISAQGREILENMLIGKAFESNPDAVRQLAAYKSLRQSVITALAEISNNIALGEYSLESELSDAIALAYNARKNGYKAGDAVSEFARQGKLFETEEDATAADYTNATVLMLADVMNDNRVTRLKKVLSIYNQQAEQSAAGQTDLFAEGVKTQQDILNEVLLLLQHGTESEQQQALDEAREQRKAAAEQGTGVQEDGDTGEGSEGERGVTPDNDRTDRTDGTEGAPSEEVPVEPPMESAGEGTELTPPGPLSEGELGPTDEAVAAANEEVDTNPTEAQKEAGNYKKGHVTIDGFDISIENPAGSTRSGTDAQGNPWSVTMHNSYGYIRMTEGVDGDHIDIFLSDHIDDWNGTVYVVDQVNEDGSFDEHKVMYGFNSAEEAREAYLSNYSEGWQGLGTITGVSREEFKKWVDSSHRKTKAFAEYKSVQTTEGQNEAALATQQTEQDNNTTDGTERTDNQAEETAVEENSGNQGGTSQDGTAAEQPIDDSDIDALIEDYKKKAAATNKIWSAWLADPSGKPADYGTTRDEEAKAYGRVREALAGVSEEKLAEMENTNYGDSLLNDLIKEERNRRNEQKEIEQRFVDGLAKQGEIGKPTKPVSIEKILPEFTSRDEQRPIMNCIYYDPEGYAVASDAYILIASKSQYDPKQEGKMVAAHKIKGVAEKGDEVEGKFMKWRNVISQAKANSAEIDLPKLRDFLAGVKELMKGSKEDATVQVRMPNGAIIGFEPEYLLKFVQGAEAMGVKEIEYIAPNRAITGRSEDGIVLLMPKKISADYSGREFYYELSDKTDTTDRTKGTEKAEKTEKTETEPKKQAKAPGKAGSLKIDDVGEKIAGARKDMRREIAKGIGEATVQSLIELPFSKAFKKPNLKKAVESGALREEDAFFFDAWLASTVNTTKPKVTQQEVRRKRYNPNAETNLERWAKQTFEALDFLRTFVEADETERDRIIGSLTSEVFPKREAQLAEFERIRELNKGRNDNITFGDCLTPNPVWVTYQVMQRLGYAVGDKLDIPFGILRGNTTGTSYYLYNTKDEHSTYIYPNSLEEGIDAIVWLARIKRGDTDIQHPVSAFYTTPTKSEMGDSGRFRVIWGGWSSMKNQEFDSKEAAEAFAAKKKDAYVNPIQEVKRRFGYKIMFRNPLTGERTAVSDMEFDTKAEAEAYMDGNYETMNDGANEMLAKESGTKKEVTADDVVGVTVTYGKDGWQYTAVINAAYANNMGMPLVLQEFKTRGEAKAYADSVKDKVFETYRQYKAKQKEFVYFSQGEDTRIGEDYRGGKDVSAEDFMNAFGFRGVQFGNWTNQADRQMAVNQAYDAFMDLAKLIGMSPRAMSLNGELGIAFGARGSGNANAHYEYDEVVINLTKTRGAGSLAHEWWHALDNYFARRGGMGRGMVTDVKSIAMRDELRKAYDRLIDEIEKSNYYKRSVKKGDYWGRMHEVTARLLAEWVNRELKQKGELNTFLARGVDTEKFVKMNYELYKMLMDNAGREAMPFEEYKELDEALSGMPYPSDKEIDAFSDALRNIFETIEEREGENGAVELFSIGDGTDGTNGTDAQQVAYNAVREALANAGIEVVEATEEDVKRLKDSRKQLKDSKGTIRGWVGNDGKIHLTKDGLNAETPIHEYTHLWAEALQMTNPDLWEQIKGLLKGTPEWQRITSMKEYSNLKDDDRIAGEVLAHISGKKNAERMEAEAKRMIDEAPTLEEAAKAANLLGRMRDALKKFWTWVGKTLLGKKGNINIDQVSNMVLADLTNGIDPFNPRGGKRTNRTKRTEASVEGEMERIKREAQANGTFMKAPNGKPTKLTERQWLQVRTEAFKKWFGDWELANKLRMIRNAVVTKINKHNYTDEQLETVYSNLESKGNVFDGRVVDFVNSTYGKIIKHKGVPTSLIIPQLAEIYDAAIPIYFENEEEKEGHKKHPNFVGYHNYLGKIDIDGKQYYVRLTVQEINTNPSKKKAEGFTPYQFHSSYISDIELYEKTAVPIKTPGTYQAIGISGKADAKLQQFFESATEAEKNSSKIVDENGEPMVVYHGGKGEITVFDKNRIGENLDYGTMGSGFYFTSDRENAENYARNAKGEEEPTVVEAFLNIRNAKDVNWNELDGESQKKSVAFTDKAIAKGHDGFTAIAPNKAQWIVAFNPNQIKSATENNGEFDAGNPDIRFSIDAPESSRMEVRDEFDEISGAHPAEKAKTIRQKYEQLLTDQVNKFRPLKQLEGILSEKKGRKLRDSESFYSKATSMSSKTFQDMEAEKKIFRKPLEQAIDAVFAALDPDGKRAKREWKCKGIRFKREMTKMESMRQELADYMIAKHGLERNEWFTQNGREEGDYSGLTGLAESLGGNPDDYKAVAERVVAEFEQLVGKENIDRFWDAVNGLNNRNLEIRYESGGMTKELYDELLARHKYYVPLTGFAEETSDERYTYEQPVKKTDDGYHKAEGRNSKPDDPLTAMLHQQEYAIVKANENQAKKALLYAAINIKSDLLQLGHVWYVYNEADNVWEERVPPVNENMTADEKAEAVKQFEAEMKALQKEKKAKRVKGKLDLGVRALPKVESEHQIEVWDGGRKYVIYVNGNPSLVRAYNEAIKDWGWFMQQVKKYNRYEAQLFTSWNPEFAVKNMMRDTRFALFSAFVTSGLGEHKMWKMRKNIDLSRRVLPHLMKDGTVSAAMLKDAAARANVEKWYKEFVENGGETGFTRTMSADEISDDINHTLLALAKGNEDGKTKVEKLVGSIEGLNRWAENSTRFAAYITARQGGKTVRQSLDEAKSVTLNFNIKGYKGQGLRAWFAFFNARLQGVAQLARLAKQNPTRFAIALGACVLQGAMMPFLNVLLLGLFGDDDDWMMYEYMSEYMANNNMVLFIPGIHKFVILPYSQELAPFSAAGNILFRHFSGMEHNKNAWEQGAELALSYLPFEVYLSDKEDTAGKWLSTGLRTLSPTVLQPTVEYLVNEGFTNTPLMKSGDYNRRDAAWTKAYESRTSKALINASKWLNGGSKKNKWGAAEILIDPTFIQHVVEGTAGGVGSFFGNARDLFTEPDWFNHLPFVRKFMLDADQKKWQGGVDKAYSKYAYDFAKEEEDRIEEIMDEKNTTEEFVREFMTERESTNYDIYNNTMQYKELLFKYKKKRKRADGTEYGQPVVMSHYRNSVNTSGNNPYRKKDNSTDDLPIVGIDGMKKYHKDLQANDAPQELIDEVRGQITEYELRMIEENAAKYYEAHVKGKKPVRESLTKLVDWARKGAFDEEE